MFVTLFDVSTSDVGPHCWSKLLIQQNTLTVCFQNFKGLTFQISWKVSKLIVNLSSPLAAHHGAWRSLKFRTVWLATSVTHELLQCELQTLCYRVGHFFRDLEESSSDTPKNALYRWQGTMRKWRVFQITKRSSERTFAGTFLRLQIVKVLRQSCKSARCYGLLTCLTCKTLGENALSTPHEWALATNQLANVLIGVA